MDVENLANPILGVLLATPCYKSSEGKRFKKTFKFEHHHFLLPATISINFSYECFSHIFEILHLLVPDSPHRNGETEEVHFRRANFWFGGRFFEQPKMAPPVVVATCSYCGSLWVYVLYVVCLCNVYVCFFDLLGLCCFSKIF